MPIFSFIITTQMQHNAEEVLCRTLAKLLNSNTHADKRTCQQREEESNRRHVFSCFWDTFTQEVHTHNRGKKSSEHRQTFRTGKIGEERLARSQQVGWVVSPASRQQRSYSHCDSLSEIGFKATGNQLENCIFYTLMTPDDGWKVGSWACTWVMRQRRRLPAASQL